MNNVLNAILNRNTTAIIGQLFIIFGLAATICLAVREQTKKPRTFWYILVNRVRYIFYVGFFKFIWYKIKAKPIEDHPYNSSYEWLMENKIHIAYQFYIFATLDLLYQMINQISTGFIFSKSKDFFISSPIRSFCIFYIIAFLINDAISWKKKYLEEAKKNGKIIDDQNRLAEIS